MRDAKRASEAARAAPAAPGLATVLGRVRGAAAERRVAASVFERRGLRGVGLVARVD